MKGPEFPWRTGWPGVLLGALVAACLVVWSSEPGPLVVMVLVWVLVGPWLLVRTARNPPLEAATACAIALATLPMVWIFGSHFSVGGWHTEPEVVAILLIAGAALAGALAFLARKMKPAWPVKNHFAPPGLLATVVAAVAGGLVFFWHELAFYGIHPMTQVVLFAGWFALSGVALLPHARYPVHEGLAAGILVSFAMLAELAIIARDEGAFFFVMSVVLVPLAIGCAALATVLAGHIAPLTRPTGAAGRLGPRITFGCGVGILGIGLLLAQGVPNTVTIGPIIVGATLTAVGYRAMRLERPRRAHPV